LAAPPSHEALQRGCGGVGPGRGLCAGITIHTTDVNFKRCSGVGAGSGLCKGIKTHTTYVDDE